MKKIHAVAGLAIRAQGVDMGALQTQSEQSAKALKAAGAALKRAQDAYVAAEESYHVAQKSLAAGFDQLRQQTKVH
jgi:hypothetical protein